MSAPAKVVHPLPRLQIATYGEEQDTPSFTLEHVANVIDAFMRDAPPMAPIAIQEAQAQIQEKNMNAVTPSYRVLMPYLRNYSQTSAKAGEPLTVGLETFFAQLERDESNKKLFHEFLETRVAAPLKEEMHGKGIPCARTRSQCRNCVMWLLQEALRVNRKTRSRLWEKGFERYIPLDSRVVFVEIVDGQICEYATTTAKTTCRCADCITHRMKKRARCAMEEGRAPKTPDVLIREAGGALYREVELSLRDDWLRAIITMKERVDEDGVAIYGRNVSGDKHVDDGDETRGPASKKRKVGTGAAKTAGAEASVAKPTKAARNMQAVQESLPPLSNVMRRGKAGKKAEPSKEVKKAAAAKVDEREDSPPLEITNGSGAKSAAGTKRKAEEVRPVLKKTAKGKDLRTIRELQTDAEYRIDPEIPSRGRTRSTRGQSIMLEKDVSGKKETSATASGTAGELPKTTGKGRQVAKRNFPKTATAPEDDTVEDDAEDEEEMPVSGRPRHSKRMAPALKKDAEDKNAGSDAVSDGLEEEPEAPPPPSTKLKITFNDRTG